VDRSASPWDSEPRRPSHADKRKALQREILQAEIQAVLSGSCTFPENDSPQSKLRTVIGG